MCNTIPFDLVCTLHGGHLTATEVLMRRKYEVVEDQWVWRQSRPSALDPVFGRMLDAAMRALNVRA